MGIFSTMKITASKFFTIKNDRNLAKRFPADVPFALEQDSLNKIITQDDGVVKSSERDNEKTDRELLMGTNGSTLTAAEKAGLEKYRAKAEDFEERQKKVQAALEELASILWKAGRKHISYTIDIHPHCARVDVCYALRRRSASAMTSLASASASAIRWKYTSRVVLVRECPSRRDTVTISCPELIRTLATV